MSCFLSLGVGGCVWKVCSVLELGYGWLVEIRCERRNEELEGRLAWLFIIMKERKGTDSRARKFMTRVSGCPLRLEGLLMSQCATVDCHSFVTSFDNAAQSMSAPSRLTVLVITKPHITKPHTRPFEVLFHHTQTQSLQYDKLCIVVAPMFAPAT